MTTKICTKCLIDKPFSSFSKSKTGKFGLQYQCKDCKREYAQKHYAPGTDAQITRLYYLRDYRKSIKEQVFKQYGELCACCGENNKSFLTLDHINNNGAAHRRELGGGRSTSTDKTWRWLVNNEFPEGFQILCYNCNCGKRDNGGVCPHKAKE